MKASDLKGIAIIGMTGRFPGAPNLDDFWRNITGGVESITTFTDEELAASGLDVATLKSDPSFVPKRGYLKDADLFDAAFFGMSANEAAVTDPQQRLFLEASWEALENAGYDPEQVDGLISVYAGMGGYAYYMNQLHGRADLAELVGERVISLGNDKDYLATRIAYKLNLRGPALNINTACSTSLVAVCQACQGLLTYQCDLALAGGVSVNTPQKSGVRYQEGGVFSPDGRCRPFDAQARGTVSSDGLGVVLLKRLSEAVKDGDPIYAVIKGFGMNNDGSAKVGFTAPSVDGQAEAIATAQAQAGFDPATISYVEAHGTATPLGDPIEIAALTQAFRLDTEERNFCALGSVKGNIGHTNTAAGIAGLIKTALALKNEVLPPSLNFTEPNPKIDFPDSPFFVNTKLAEWKAGETPRRAGVSSFGLGGTNAHIVLEEAPAAEPSAPSRKEQLLVFSAKTAAALDAATDRFLAHLKANPNVNLADAAYTLQTGRRAFPHRRTLVSRNVDEAIEALGARDSKRLVTRQVESKILDAKDCPVVFMFPGQGSQYVNMGADLYRTEPVFKEQVDRCAEILLPTLGLDLRQVLYPPAGKETAAEEALIQTRITQPALFTIEYALANLWMSWGIKPAALIGHSIGEYVAACLAGVFTLEDALSLVAQRGRLIQGMPRGSMLAVPMTEDELLKILPPALSLAAVNGLSRCVVSGSSADVEAFLAQLTASGKTGRALHTSHAFHSSMMEPVLEPFAECVRQVKRGRPTIPFLSNLTGTWITAEEAGDPQYWTRHLRQGVRFADGIGELLKKEDAILLEVGPGTTLNSLAKLQTVPLPHRAIFSSLRHPQEEKPDLACLLTALGQLWSRGVKMDWAAFYANEQRRRISLPTYPFQRERYWIERQTPAFAAAPRIATQRVADPADWFYLPTWKRSELPSPAAEKNRAGAKREWLVFADEGGLGKKLAKSLAWQKESVTQVVIGPTYKRLADGIYAINPERPGDYEALIDELCALGKAPHTMVHLWSVSYPQGSNRGWARLDRSQDRGLHSLLCLVRALAEKNVTGKVDLEIISNNVHAVTGEETLYPEKATVLGAGKVIPLEYPNIRCRCIDLLVPETGTRSEQKLLDQLLNEFATASAEPVVAYRAGYRWVEMFDRIRLDAPEGAAARLKAKGVYLITGGLGGVGLSLAEFLAAKVQAKLIFIGRTAFPARELWANWLATHEAQDETSVRIRQLRDFESAGAETLVLTADVTDRDQMRDAMAEAKKRFGPIDGVIHAAGSADRSGVIQRRTKEATEGILAAKVKGTLVLNELLGGGKLDFFVLCSTLGNVVSGGKFGQVGYAAANEFLDAFAYYKRAMDDVYTVTINWDNWRDVGMSARAAREHARDEKSARALTSANSLSTQEGVDVFNRILNQGFAQVVVSVADLEARRRSLAATQDPSAQEAEAARSQAMRHARPEVATAFTPATNDSERMLAGIWQEIFGLQDVGIDDNFFDLGGDSLLAVQLINKITKAFHFTPSIPVFFQNPTVRKLAAVVGHEDRTASATASAQTNESDARLVSFQTKGSRPPLFFLHGDWAGGGLYCGRLSQQLGEDQPFYALPPYRSPKKGIITLEEMVAYHIAIMREHTPHGPYLLGGYCVGAKVAMEMARQLVAQGEDVPHLLLLDLPQRFVPWLHEIWTGVDKVGDVLKWDLLKRIQFFDRYPVAFTRWLRLSSRSKATTICRRLGLLRPNGSSPVVMGLEGGKYDEEIVKSLDYAVYFLASCLFTVRPLAIPTTLYFSEESLPRSFRVKRSNETFPTATLEMVPGNHVTCITKYASVVADKMEKTLDRLDGVLCVTT
jgi:acyl transferase domain-containing protein/acyl carrier protein